MAKGSVFVKALALLGIGLLTLFWLRIETQEIDSSPSRKETDRFSKPIHNTTVKKATTVTTTTIITTPPKHTPSNTTPSRTTFEPSSSPYVVALTTNPQTHAPAQEKLFERLRASEIVNHFEKQPLEFQQIPRLFPRPAIDNYDIMAIYSQPAWLTLREMLTTRSVTMMVSAGSSLAGVNSQNINDRAQRIFANLFYNVTVVERAHGSRNSFHFMELMHSFFPARVDLVLWEFATNDVAYNVQNHETAHLEQRNQFILYLEQLARVSKERQQQPPLVVLLYLWSTPFKNLDQSVFQSHRHLGANYDFVVGHVNALQYFQSWHLPRKKVKAVAIKDKHHPNVRGHMILAFLLHDFVSNQQRREMPKQLHPTRPTFTWACGNETREKILVRDLLHTRYPVASFTEELPRNEEFLPGMLRRNPTGNVTIANVGEHFSYRVDRQNCIILPCCQIGNISFDVSQYSPLEGIQVNVSPYDDGTAIFLDGNNVTTNLISAKHWDCLLSINAGPSTFLTNWVVLEQNRRVSEISFCNSVASCANDSQLALMSFAVFGGQRDLF